MIYIFIYEEMEMVKERKAQISVHIMPETLRTIEQIAKAQRRTRNELVRILLEDAVSSSQKKEISNGKETV